MLDLADLFFAIPVDEESQAMAAFTREGGQCQFSRLRQGRLNSSVKAYNLLIQDTRSFRNTQHTHKLSFPVPMTSLFMVITCKNR